MQELDDITIKSAARGNRKSFKAVYDYYSPFVWKVAYRTLNGDREAGEQVVQDIFIKVYNHLKDFKFNASFSTWLYRIAYNELLAYLNKRKKISARDVVYDDSIGGDGKNAYENRELVAMILKRLTAKERFLLVAREVNNIPFEDLAAVTGDNPGALRTQLHRIRESIKTQFVNDSPAERSEIYAS